MFNIKFKGKFTNENQLKRGKLSVNATKFKEPDSISKAFLLGALISSPILLISTILFVLKVENPFKLPLYQSVSMLIITFALLYVHELIHALALPKDIEKEIWTKLNEGALFVHFNGSVSKLRFIWVCISPNLILGYIPFILFIFGVFDFNNTLATSIGIISWIMILSGIGDYLNIYNSIRQVPKGAKVLNYGLNSYWVK